MTSADHEDSEGGAFSIESWDDEAACVFEPDTCFAINQRSVDTLRWYSYLSPADDRDDTLLQSRDGE